MNEFFNALKNKRARHEYIKSIIVGLFSTVLDFFLTALIIYLSATKFYTNIMSAFNGTTISGIPYVLPISVYMTATVVGFFASVLVNYLLSVFFVYQYGNVGKNAKGFLKFCVFAFIGLTLTTLGSLVFSQIFGLGGSNVFWIKVCITVAVFIFNFFTRKYFVFNIALIRDDENTIKL